MSFGRDFLAAPDLFPARPAGPRWGNGTAAIGFAGARYRLHGLAGWQLDCIQERFGPLAVPALAAGPQDPEAIDLDLFAAPADDFLGERERPFFYTFDLAHDPAAVRVAGLRFVARVEWRPQLRGALWTCVDEREFAMVFENFFRLVCAYALAASDGALLHSAAVEVDGGAVVLFGPSGAGKTTIGGLAMAAGRRVLSDDLNAIAATAASARVEKVPFAGDLGGGPDPLPPLPLRALCRLRKGPTVEVSRLSPAAALAALFAAAPFVNADPFRSERLEASLLALARVVPVVDLVFARDTPWDAIAAAAIASGTAPWG